MQKTSNITISIVDVQKFKIIKLQPSKKNSKVGSENSNPTLLSQNVSNATLLVPSTS